VLPRSWRRKNKPFVFGIYLITEGAWRNLEEPGETWRNKEEPGGTWKTWSYLEEPGGAWRSNLEEPGGTGGTWRNKI